MHEEWIRALLKKRPDLTREKPERMRMDKHTTDALVSDDEDLIEA